MGRSGSVPGGIYPHWWESGFPWLESQYYDVVALLNLEERIGQQSWMMHLLQGAMSTVKEKLSPATLIEMDTSKDRT